MVASPGGKIGPVYELGQRFSVGEMCYVRKHLWGLVRGNLMGNCSVSPTRESGCTRIRPDRCSYSSDTGRSRNILECPKSNGMCPDKQNSYC